MKDIGGRNSCVATPCSPLIPHWTHQSSMVNPSGLLSVCFLSPHLPPHSAVQPPTPHHCKPRHVQTGHGTIPLSKQGHRNNYKKINTGMRCHLVSRPANTSLGNVPCSLWCTNPANGSSGGMPPPTTGLPSNLSDSLTPSAQVCGEGLLDSTFFVQTLV